MTRSLACCLVLAGCATTLPNASAPRAPSDEGRALDTARYRFDIAPTLASLDGTVCFEQVVPAALVPARAAAADAFVFVRSASSGRELPRDRRTGGWALDGVASGECVAYRVRLARAAAEWSRELSFRSGDGLVTSTALWLLLPSSASESFRATAEFVGDVPVELPWRALGTRRYALDVSCLRFIAYAVFGRYRSIDVDVPGASLRIAALDGCGVSDDDLEHWARAHAQAVASLFGRFPVARALLVVIERESASAVDFGMVARGGGASLLVYVGQGAHSNRAALERDWVLTHELSHLATPFITREDAWLGEGIATYYQEILRARVGLQTSREAWTTLARGFRVGAERGTGRTMREESRAMFETYAFQAVYWSGAAYALALDLALRDRGLSLDDALARVMAMPDAFTRVWTADELLGALDEATETRFAAELAGRVLDVAPLLDAPRLLEELGVAHIDGETSLVAAPRSSLRDAITRPRPTAAAAARD